MTLKRSTILHPLGWEAGKPVPVPQGVNDYTKKGEHREIKNLKPLQTGFKKDK